MDFQSLAGNLTGLPRILAALATGGVSELAVNAKQNLDAQNSEAAGIDAGSGIPAFAYKEQTPEQINEAKGRQLAALGTTPALELYKNYSNDPITALSKQEKKAQIQNIISEASVRGEQLNKIKREEKASQNLQDFRKDLFPSLIESGSEPQGPLDASGATLPPIAAGITTDPTKLQQAATSALLHGDETLAEGLNKMQRNRNLNLQDEAKINYYNAKAKSADTTTIIPTVMDQSGIPVTGDDFLKAIPPQRANAAKSLAEGRGVYPTGTYAKSPAGQQLLADALQYDPNLDANTFRKRGAAQIAYGSGTQGKNVVALKTGIDHLIALNNAVDKLTDTGSPALNSLVNKAEKQVGNTGITNYNTILDTAVPEILKAYVPSGGTEKGKDEIKANFDASLTKRQKKEAIATQAELMANRIDELQSGFDEAMGKVTKPLVSPEMRQRLEILKGNLSEPAPTTPVQAAQQKSAPKVFKRVNGQLVRVQ